MAGAVAAGRVQATEPSTLPSGRRVTNVDVLRAFAALGVLGVHAYALGGRAVPIKAQYWYDVPLITLSTGVWLFFAISGYVITRPFVIRLVENRPPPEVGSYALRRALRIFPLYWVALIAIIAIDGATGTRSWQYPLHFLLLNNLVPGRQEALFSPAWTLTLEVLFYIAVPLLAAAVRVRGPITAERLARFVLLSWLASIAFTVLADLLGDGQTGLWLRGSLPAMWQMFCPGILLAIAPHLDAQKWRHWLVERPGQPVALVVAAGALVAGAMLGAAAPLRFGIVPYQLLVDASRPLFALGYGLLIAAAIRAPAWRDGARWLIELGLVSYGIYLLHPVIESLLIKAGLVPLRRDTPAGFVLNVVVLAALTLPLALLSWRCFERPVIALGRRLGAPAGDMRGFWNARARENAFYFVDTRQAYRAPDPDRFWQASELLDYLLEGLGVSLRGDEAVLEIGCGVGRITRELAHRTASVIAVDVSDEMLARARELNPEADNVRWLLGDGVSLTGVTDASMDACVTVVVLQHVPDPEITLGYIREVGRVLKSGGWAALQVSNDPSTHRPRDGLRLRLGALLGRSPKGQRHAAWLGSHVELPAVRAAAEASGTSVERVWGEGTQYCQVLLRKR